MKRLLIIGLLVILFACDRNQIGPQYVDGSSGKLLPFEKVYLVNEGNFQWGNASISLYYPYLDSVEHAIFQTINQVPLGDVAQSMIALDDKCLIAVNNSSKLELVDTLSFQHLNTISGLSSPRFAVANPEKLYVSDLKANSISILDITDYKTIGHIGVNGWTEHMLLFGQKIFVGEVLSGHLLVVNTHTDQITDTIKVGKVVDRMVLDRNEKLWVLCKGDFSEPGSLLQIDPANHQILKSFNDFEIGDNLLDLAISPDRNILYFLNNGVWKMAIDDHLLPSDPFITTMHMNLYALGIHPVSGDIFIADAGDYIQQSWVSRYSSDAHLISRFKAGINCGDFLFMP